MATFTADELITRYTLDGRGYSRGAQGVLRDTARMTASMLGLRGVLGRVASAIGSPLTAVAALTGAGGVLGLAAASVKAASDMQGLEMSLRTVAGSAEEASHYMSVLREIAKLPGISTEESVRGFIQLFTVTKDARFSASVLKEFSNAIASVGYGSEEMGRAIVNLTQILGLGKLTGDELREMSMLIPQFRQALMTVFGSADTETLMAKGLDARVIVEGVLDEFKKLARAPESPKVIFENLAQQVKLSMAEAGSSILKLILPPLKEMTRLLERVVRSGIIERIGQSFAKLAGSGGVIEGMRRGLSLFLAGLANMPVIFEWVKQRASSFFDMIRRNLATMAAVLGAIFLTGTIYRGMMMIVSALNAISTATSLATTAQMIFQAVATRGMSIAVSVVSATAAAAIGYSIYKGIENAFSIPEGQEPSGGIGKILADAQKFYTDLAVGTSGGNSVVESTIQAAIDALGGPSGELGRQTNYLAQISQNTHEALRIDMQRHILGGGDLGRLGVTAVELGAVKGHGGSIKVEIQGAKNFESALAGMVTDTIAGLVRSGKLRIA